jgi:hypothetical protein
VEFLQAFGIRSRGRIIPHRTIRERELQKGAPLNQIPLDTSSLYVPKAELAGGGFRGVNRRRREGFVHRSVQAGNMGELRFSRLLSILSRREHCQERRD